MSDRPRLRVIHGGRGGRRIGGVLVTAAPLEQSPFVVDAVVYQEDTFGVLAAPAEAEPSDDHPIRLFHEAASLESSAVGSVTVVEGAPLRLHAVVCDLDAQRPCRPEWVRAAFTEAMKVVGTRGVEALGAELLGAAYGHMSVEEASAVLLEVVANAAPSSLRRLWLIVPGGIDPSRVLAAT